MSNKINPMNNGKFDFSGGSAPDLSDYIKKDGTTTTTAIIPFALGIKSDIYDSADVLSISPDTRALYAGGNQVAFWGGGDFDFQAIANYASTTGNQIAGISYNGDDETFWRVGWNGAASSGTDLFHFFDGVDEGGGLRSNGDIIFAPNNSGYLVGDAPFWLDIAASHGRFWIGGNSAINIENDNNGTMILNALAYKISALTTNGVVQTTGGNGALSVNTNVKKKVITLNISAGSSLIAVGSKGYVCLPISGTITGWRIAEVSETPITGSIVVDVWKDTTGNYPPTVSDSIAGSEKPTLSSAKTNSDLTLTTWTTTVTAGDFIGINVDSNTDCKNVQVQILMEVA